MKKKNMLIVLIIIVSTLAIIGFSYAFFSLEIEGTSRDNIIVTGDLRIKYTDNDEVSLVDAMPGDSVSKEVTIENIGTLDAVYTMKLNNFNNEITNNELKLDYTCTRYNSNDEIEGTCEGKNDIDLPTLNGNFVIKSDILIEPTYKHKYTMTFKFIDTSENQNYNKNKGFAARMFTKTFVKAVDTNVNTENASVSAKMIIGDPVTLSLSVDNLSQSNVSNVTYVIYRMRRSETEYTQLGTITSDSKSTGFKVMYDDDNDIDYKSDYVGGAIYSYKIQAFNTDTGKLLNETIITENFCFVAGTKVLTSDGYKNIEDIKIGDIVYSYNLDNNELELKKVVNTITSYTKDTYKVTIDGKEIEMSPKHQVYIIDKGWVRAYDLKIGDKMLKSDKSVTQIENIEYKVYDKVIPTYNLTIEGNSNFYVSEIQVLVHNLGSAV